MAPSCAPSAVITTEASQQEAVAACLERLRPGHFQAKRLAFEIRDVGFTPAGSLGTLQVLVRWIFNRAMTDPERFAGPCAALCFSLSPILPNFKPPGALTAQAKAKRIDFRQTLLNLCQREFESACTASLSDTAVTDGSAKPGANLAGSLQFLAYLYLHALLTDRIMLTCLLMVSSAKAIGQGADGSDSTSPSSIGPQRVDCLVKALLVAGRQLDECLADQHRPLLDGLYEQLGTVQKGAGTAELTPEQQASLERLLQMRAGGWAKSDAADPVAASSTNGQSSANGPSWGPTVSKSVKDISTVATVAAVKPSQGSPFRSAAAGPSARGASGGWGNGPAAGAAASNKPAAAAAPGPVQPLLRRAQGSSSNSLTRPASQNLEGLWELTAETFNDVRAQLVSLSAGNSPATLEAMADDLVESAVAACGGDNSCPCWGVPQQPRPVPSAATAGVVAGASAAPEPLPLLADEDWAQQVQQQWDEQLRACDIYGRLCVEALQQMGVSAPAAPPPVAAPLAGSSNGSSSCNGASSAAAGTPPIGNGAAAAPGGAVGDTGRAFRRLLLSSTQTHFERCLAALLGGSDPSAQLPSPSTHRDTAGAAAQGDANGTQRRAWGDMPAVLPDAALTQPRARGVCHLLLALLRHGVLTPRIVLHCAAALVDGAGGGSVACLQCACMLLAGCGKQARTFKMAEAAAFESLLKRLQSLADADDAGGEDASARQLRKRFVSWLGGCLRDR